MKVSAWAAVALGACYALGFLALGRGLYRVQVTEVADFREDLNSQATRRFCSPGSRGRILDSRGGVLAQSRPSRDIVCDVTAFKGTTISNTLVRIDREVGKLAAILGRPRTLTAERIMRHLRFSGAIPLVAWADADEATMARFEERSSEFAGFSASVHAERVYPRGKFAAHLIGYTGRERAGGDGDEMQVHFADPDLRGRSGIEAYYNDYLAGVAGVKRIPVDARGFKPGEKARQNIALGETTEREAENGLDLTLTIDPELQQVLEAQLDGVCGAGVILDPRDGAVLAMASAPAFDPNDFVPFISEKRYRALADDPDHPLVNRATSGLYAPGSTFKPVTALAALRSGINPEELYCCDGVYTLGTMHLRCWSHWGHGNVNMGTAIERSCNPYFARLGYLIGTNSLFRTAREFGFAGKTGIDFAPESAGSLTAPPFYPGLASQTAIGQGRLQVTPLQMAVECATIANGGKVFAPYLKKRAAGAAAEPIRRLSNRPGDIEIVRRGMLSVVEAENGTGKTLGGLKVKVAGKTGTAQLGNGLNNTWIIAFAPYENPELAVAMVVEHGVSGGKTVAPRVHAVFASRYGEAEK